ncbi:type VII secretion-associated serine protease mycosin [Actinomadura viridis]|uniref:Subtilisin family serine protease n=1 Tax=Actinomadura viridis TaxID=58110 RepID=A0A931DTA0_9ACTN|nr:S8/S53 family peptidase [Actinomadura viridis]MBG6093522.1 subtilisin family serine protease [Actinomadura viridis]
MSAGFLAILLVAGISSPAAALPRPRDELYWFDWWEIEKKVWPITKGKGVTVAVLDNGVNPNLPDLRGAILKGVNPSEPDVGLSKVGKDRKNGGHGTAMAALIVARGGGTGMMGVAPEAKVLPVVGHRGGSWALAIDIRYAADRGAQVISMSIGSATFMECPMELQAAVAYAVKKDVVLVASAGNEGRFEDWRNWPANCAGVMTVGGLDGYVKPWPKTTPGNYMAVAAPAAHVGTINWNGRFRLGDGGTSPSAALTAGVVALVRSKYPEMPAEQVVQRVLATTKDVGPPGWDDVTGHGLVRPYRALVDKVPSTAPNPVYDRLRTWQKSRERPAAAKSVMPSRATKKQSATRSRGQTSAWVIGAVVFSALCLLLGGWRIARNHFK